MLWLYPQYVNGSINCENEGTHLVYQMLWEYITFGVNFLIEEVIDIMSPTNIPCGLIEGLLI